MARRVLPGFQGGTSAEFPSAEDFAGRSPNILSQVINSWSEKLSAGAQKAMELQLSPSDWISKYFYVDRPRDPITAELFEAGPIRIASHQRRILEAALEKDADGKFKYSTIMWSEPKKSGKTTLASAVTLFMAHRNKASHIYCLANDGKQSQDRIFKSMDRCIKLHQIYGGLFEDIRPIWAPPSFRLNNGTVVEAIPCDAAGEAGSEPLMTVWCFDRHTDILTRSGWRTVDSLRFEDEIATLSPEGMFEWQKQQDLNKMYYVGKMWLVESKRVSLCVTPQHRIYGKFCGDGNKSTIDKVDWDVKPIEEAVKWSRIGLRTSCDGWVGEIPDICEIDGTDFLLAASTRKPYKRIPLASFVQLLGWYLSEGQVLWNNKRKCAEGIEIAQSKTHNPENRATIIELLTGMGFKVHEHKDGIGLLVYDARLGNFFQQFGYSRDKFVPQWVKDLPVDYLELFLNAYYLGDGNAHYDNIIRIATTSQVMAGDLQEIAQKIGYGSYCATSVDDKTLKPSYVVNIHLKGSAPSIYKGQWKQIDYIGPVYCPSVPNHIVLVRRDGVVYWMGNSEMWGYRQEAKERLWTEMTIPPTLYGYALRWVESYAGYEDESTILWNLYDNGVNHGVRHPQLMDLPVYINGSQFTYWNHEAMMPWQTKEYYEDEAKLMLPNEFLRIHKNMWVSATSSLFDNMVPWDKCIDERAGPLKPGDDTPMVIALDASISGDASAVIGVTRHPDDSWDAPVRRVMVRESHVFYPPAGAKLNYSQTLEPLVRQMCQDFNVYKVVYDPYQLHKMCTDLSMDGVAAFEEFDQGRRRSKADKQLYDCIIMRSLRHNGDPELRQHVQNCAAKSEGASNTLRFVKKAAGRPIDMAVALSMATDEVLRLNC